MPQCRNTITVSEVARARRTACMSLGTSFADASPGLLGPAVHAETSSSSSTWVAPMSGDALAVDRAAEWSIRLLCVQPDPDDWETGAPRSGERVAKPCFAVVETVVVGHRRDVHSSRRERGEGARRRAEDEGLRCRRAACRDRGLEIHDGEVGTAEHRADGSENELGCERGAPLRSPLRNGRHPRTQLHRPTRGSRLPVREGRHPSSPQLVISAAQERRRRAPRRSAT